ncbi:MAG: hypothetical protein Fur006_65960 [Coleofasciculaceae cyanobacterium]
MLIFFIHGVATQDVKYAQSLESLIREEFKKRGKSCPHWNNHRTASLITINVLREKIKLRLKIINQVINHLKQVPGMTCPWAPSFRLYLLAETLEEINFKDGSGKLILCVNPLQVHYVYVFDRNDNCKFRGYVGLIHGDGLKQSVDLIKKNYC